MCLVIAWWIVTLDTFDHQRCLAKPHLITVRALRRRDKTQRKGERGQKERANCYLRTPRAVWTIGRFFAEKPIKKTHIKKHSKWHAIKLREKQAAVGWTCPWDKDTTPTIAQTRAICYKCKSNTLSSYYVTMHIQFKIICIALFTIQSNVLFLGPINNISVLSEFNRRKLLVIQSCICLKYWMTNNCITFLYYKNLPNIFCASLTEADACLTFAVPLYIHKVYSSITRFTFNICAIKPDAIQLLCNNSN